MSTFIDRSSCSLRQCGLTLIELLVAFALVAMLATAGVTGISSLFNNMEARSNADQLANALAFARQQAVSLVTTVTVCSSDDGTSCADDTDWGLGWIIFEDPNRDPLASCTRDINEEIFRVRDMSASRGTLQSNTGCISYDKFGENRGSALTARSCGVNADVNSARDVSVSAIGAISVSRSSGGAVCPF